MKKVLLAFLVLVTTVIGAVLVFSNSSNTKTINVDCVGIHVNALGEVDERELLVINTCYDYLKKYYKSSLPDNTKELEQIYNNLNIVFSNDLYFKGFSESVFQECLENDSYFSQNGGVYEEEYIKLLYYTRLISVKLKTQLLLGEYQTFIDDYKKNFSLFVFLNLNFADVLLLDSNFEKRPDLISEVCDAYDLIIQCSDNETELAMIYQSALRLNATNCEDVRIEQYSNKFFEYVEYLPDNLINYQFENPDLNPYKIEIIRER